MFKFALLLLIISSFYICSCSSTIQSASDISEISLPLYQGAIPNALPSDDLERVRHRRNNNIVLEGITHPSITGYFPATKSENRKAVIICPGGGYGGLSMVAEGSEVATRLAESGIVAFVLKYRMPLDKTMDNKAYGPLQDIQQAIKLVRNNSKKWRLDDKNIGVMGFSAGGHLAASAAVHFIDPAQPILGEQNLRPDFQILLYPVISFSSQITHKGSRRNLLGDNYTQEQIRYFSNELHVTSNSPPAFIVHASDDAAVPVQNALVYHNALFEKNVPSQLLILPEGGHGFGMRHKFDWFTSMMMWIDTRE